MRKTLLLILISVFSLYLFGQQKDTKDSDKLLKEMSEKACKCVDSINTYNVSKEDVSVAISKCIDSYTGAYIIGKQMLSLDLSALLKNDDKKNIKINIDLNKDSKSYKENYYELERYMMDNCNSLKRKIVSSDLENYFSVSKNPKAKEYYDKGIEESEKENFKKAITYFQKALKVDSLFAFAWDNIGICYRRLNNYDEAIYAYNKSLELDPMGMMPLQNVAVAYSYKKEYDKAIAAYERLAEIDTKNPEVFYGIGLVYAFNLNDPEKGLDNMCKAYNLYIEQKSPYRTDAEKMIGYIYTDMKKQGKDELFKQILQKYKITANFVN